MRALFYILIVCLFFGSCAPKQTRRVLVIHSYEQAYAGYPKFNELIKQQFAKNKIHVDIRTIYLDCEFYNQDEEIVAMSKMLDSISVGWNPEVVLVNEDQATYSLLASEHRLSRNVPVVFGGVNYPNMKLINSRDNVTGFRDSIDVVANINMAKKLFGEKSGLFVILDSTYIDCQIREQVGEQIKGLKVVGFNNNAILSDYRGILNRDREAWRLVEEEGYTRLSLVGSRLNQGDAKLMWVLRKHMHNQCYLQLKRDFTTTNIGNMCYSPSLTAINEAFGFGEKIFGGYFSPLSTQVQDMVGAAERILNGESPANMPIGESEKEYLIDWQVLSGLKVPINPIPSEYKIVNIPLREQYPVLWAALLGMTISITALLVVWLFLLYRREHRRKQRALNDLADEKQTLALAVEGGNTYVWRYENDLFLFEEAFWVDQQLTPCKLSFDELLQFIHPDDQQMSREYWTDTKDRKQISQLRVSFHNTDYQWWEFRYSTVMLDSGASRTVGLALNIDEFKAREQELEEARLLAEKAELKQSFLANMSHEIRTPLNAIVGFSNLLASGDDVDPQDRQMFIDSINRNTELLLKLINDILEISRIESGSMSFEIKECLVSDLVDNIYQTHQILISPNIEFRRAFDSVPMTIRVDEGRLTQVLTNFLNNASKFTSQGHIELGYQYMPNEKCVCIYVEDTGKGISASEQKMIFSRFYKQDEFSQGTGLGLSICQVIVEKLGGRIKLSSKEGQGSRFMVIIPCEPC